MRTLILTLFILIGISNTYAQINNLTEEFQLPNSLNESSGAIYFNNKLITHNDSGGQNELYELDTSTELVSRTVIINNATNVDWEDITQDENYIYIGDIGNNINGNRTDLKIYKINKSDYISSTSVTAEIINFSYADQTDFTATGANNTEWDAEALVSFDTKSLMLFSKNWLTGITKAYLISKTPGTYTLTELTTPLNSGGLISGGTYNALTGKLFLVGYTSTLFPFIWKSEGFTGHDVFSGTNTQTLLSSSFSFEQTEAITFVDENSYFITSEAFDLSPITISDYAKLISFTTDDDVLSLDTSRIKDSEIMLYPNPVDTFLYVKNKNVISIEIYDTKSVQLYNGNSRNIDMSVFSKGIYFVKINLNNHRSQTQKIIKK